MGARLFCSFATPAPPTRAAPGRYTLRLVGAGQQRGHLGRATVLAVRCTWVARPKRPLSMFVTPLAPCPALPGQSKAVRHSCFACTQQACAQAHGSWSRLAAHCLRLAHARCRHTLRFYITPYFAKCQASQSQAPFVSRHRLSALSGLQKRRYAKCPQLGLLSGARAPRSGPLPHPSTRTGQQPWHSCTLALVRRSAQLVS